MKKIKRGAKKKNFSSLAALAWSRTDQVRASEGAEEPSCPLPFEPGVMTVLGAAKTLSAWSKSKQSQKCSGGGT